MKKLSVLLFIALLLLTSCKEKTPVVEPEIPDDPSMHVPIVSITDEPLETTLTKDTMIVTATDIKGSGTTYKEEVDTAMLTATRLCQNWNDMAEHLNYGEDGKYYAVFYLLSTIYAYNPDDTANFGEMDKMIMRFFAGATAENGYTPDEPLTLVMRDDAYSAQHSRIGDKDIYIETIYVQIPETGEEVGVLVYQDPLDGYWHLYSGYDKLLKDAE